MIVSVQYMAQLRTLVGVSEEQFELPEASHALTLVKRIAQDRSAAASHLLAESDSVRPSLLIAINGKAIALQNVAATMLEDGDVVTLLPPIAGG